MSKHRSAPRRAIPSFASILTLCALIGVSGTVAALAFASDEASTSHQLAGRTYTVASGEISNGTSYALSVTETDNGICLSPKLGDESGAAVLCGPDMDGQRGDINLIYTEADGNLLITPLLSDRVDHVSIDPADQGDLTVDVSEDGPSTYAQAEAVGSTGLRVAVITVPLRSTTGEAPRNDAPPSVSFRLTAYDAAGEVLAAKMPSTERGNGPIDEAR
jgi:hypothetical protein